MCVVCHHWQHSVCFTVATWSKVYSRRAALGGDLIVSVAMWSTACFLRTVHCKTLLALSLLRSVVAALPSNTDESHHGDHAHSGSQGPAAVTDFDAPVGYW